MEAFVNYYSKFWLLYKAYTFLRSCGNLQKNKQQYLEQKMAFNLFDFFFGNRRSLLSQLLLLKFFLLLFKMNPVQANDHNNTETPSNDQYPGNFKVIIPVYLGSILLPILLTTLAYILFCKPSAHPGFEEIRDTPSIPAQPTATKDPETYNTNAL